VSQRKSGYDRKAHDLYETPEWVTLALMAQLPKGLHIWEPACGSGKMVRVLAREHIVEATDITTGADFLKTENSYGCNAIITNPPFQLAQEFIEHALTQTDFVAMLLRVDFDSAKSRRHLFGECAAFAKKVVLTKRIVWFEPAKASPSYNHAWFVWDWKHSGPPTIAYHGVAGNL
jgi:hypothetical protein